MVKNYVNGEWVPSTGKSTVDIINPATEEVLGHCPLGTAEDVNRAVAAAKAAFPAWRRTPAIDIDVRRLDAAEAVEALAYRVLGQAPVRIGLAPKRLLVYRAATPFPKLKSGLFVMPGDLCDEPGYKPHAVEILGDGEQFVAFGTHPGTGRPYHWLDDSLLDLMVEATVDLAFQLTTPVIVSGGVSSLDDLKDVKKHEKSGIVGVICGRALYDGRVDLARAVKVLKG